MKRGRKGEYEKWLSADGLSLISGWARQGLSDADIAYNMGIVKSTLCEWKNKHKEFSDAISQNKDIADTRVENALYESALGGSVPAIQFWLKNRQPARWREKPDNDPNLAIELITKLVDSNMEMAKSVHTKASGSNAKCE